MSYKMSILRSDEGNGGSVERFFFEYPSPCGRGPLYAYLPL